MDGWMDGVSIHGATPWDTDTPALRSHCPCQLSLLDLFNIGSYVAEHLTCRPFMGNFSQPPLTGTGFLGNLKRPAPSGRANSGVVFASPGLHSICGRCHSFSLPERGPSPALPALAQLFTY